MGEDFQKDLGRETLLAQKAEKGKISSGIREFDEMIGGGFTPASINLIQENLGCGADILSYCIARANLNLSNKVLIIFSDPLSKYLVERLTIIDQKGTSLNENESAKDSFVGKGQTRGNNLYTLDLVSLSESDVSLMEDKMEVQLKISSAIDQMVKDIDGTSEEDTEKFILYFTLNPFLLKLGPSTLDIMYNSLVESSKSNYVQVIIMQKNIINQELSAKIQSLCHLVCDLSATDIGGITSHYIRVLKHAGTIHDIKAEPYIVEYNREMDKYNFLIRGAFLTSFETLRNLLKYQQGTIFLANVPYLIAPVDYFNILLEMPLNLSIEGGKREINEKSQAIGRKLTNATKSLYYLDGVDLLKATLRQMALFGFGNLEIEVYEDEENLLIINIQFQKEFHERSYKLFIKGMMEGIIRSVLERTIRSVRIIKLEMTDSEKDLNMHHYKIIIRLSPLLEL
ncbi:MAG: hypothetical protein EU544_02050 [Promethearchaeota archaeon]|nr:MAG: hypothetical protein EU544_02050 [Candidatus Lokiarchaeota archaeon]